MTSKPKIITNINDKFYMLGRDECISVQSYHDSEEPIGSSVDKFIGQFDDSDMKIFIDHISKFY